jgi:CCR4-NOT transcriptional regulation complex NOT5 subunit
LTHGLTDAAVKLWDAKAKKGAAATNGKSKAKPLPEHTELAKKLERHDPTSAGFFTLFGFISERRYVSAEESAKANAAEKVRRSKQKAGEETEAPPEEEDFEDAEVEICPYGADLALALLEDVWPNAIKYFTTAQENDDEQLSELDFEEMSDDSDAEVDIRALVKGKGSKRKEKISDGESPPPKARKV